jgi:hypothetical protein
MPGRFWVMRRIKQLWRCLVNISGFGNSAADAYKNEQAALQE